MVWYVQDPWHPSKGWTVGNTERDTTTYNTRPPGGSIFWINDLIHRPSTVEGLHFLCIYDVQYVIQRHSNFIRKDSNP